MARQKQEIQAQLRTIKGKQVKQLRRAGRLPGVVYGPLMNETVQVTVDAREFGRFYVAHGHATLIDITWDGGDSRVFIRDVQVDPVKRTPLHVDFYAPNMRTTMKVSVPVVLQNLSERHSGVLSEQLTEVEVEGTPDDIPSQIVADISGLVNAGDALRVGDLVLPKNIVATAAPETVIAILDDTSNDRAAQGGGGDESAPEDAAADEAGASANAGEDSAAEG
jgi:large subunit ribosomal protein L25